jgi:glucose/arabinose dehydrogenase
MARDRRSDQMHVALGVVSLVLLVLAATMALVPRPSRAAVPPQPSGFSRSLYVSGFNGPSTMTWAPDGRLFVTEETGRLWLVNNGIRQASPYLQLTVDSEGDRGLLGVAFDPDFASNHYLYVYYTATTPTVHNRVSRFVAGDTAVVPGSEQILLEFEPLVGIYHEGGAIHFGPDGKLYVAVGENTIKANSQSLDTRLGKMLRVNSDGTIPNDNPFWDQTTGVNRAIWAIGLRNPFTFAFDPVTGKMLINDVGEARWEEVNEGRPAGNYGWPDTEGPTTDPRFISPVYAYQHVDPGECAVIGGAFYRPSVPQFPDPYTGKYFFADHCVGWIRILDPAAGYAVSDFATGFDMPVSVRVGPDGALYVLQRGGGSNQGAVYRIAWTGSSIPTITTQPQPVTVAPGEAATFSVAAFGPEPLRYQWRRNDSDIAGATAASYTVSAAQLSDDGASFRVLVSNNAGGVLSDPATLTVRSAAVPTIRFTEPKVGATYRAGSVIRYSGSATDVSGASIPASGFTWWADFHHNTHTHSEVPARTGARSGSFTVPLRGETDVDVFYRVWLRVVDPQGRTATAYRDVVPLLSTITLRTSPFGLLVTLDGEQHVAPFTFVAVENQQRSIGSVSPQPAGGVNWTFDSWSDGGTSVHDIAIPTTNKSYWAVSRVAGGSVGTGTGLSGSYFNNEDFTLPVATRLDRWIGFYWGNGMPIAGVGGDTFSARWTGTVQPQFSGTHTFVISSDAGMRVWVNGVKIIDDWGPHAVRQATGAISLTAGVRYPIQVDFHDDTATATATLSWRSAAMPLPAFIPQSQLYVP